MSVEIEPFELSFQRPFTVEVAQTLTIKNPNSTPIAFKVKTTAPKQYCVRPNAGRIEPGQDFNVSVLLQAMKQDVSNDAKCRDKFLVQSAPITPDKEFSSIASVLETTDKSLVQDRKIRVNWLAPAGAGAPSAPLSTPSKRLSNGTPDTPDLTSRAFSSPSGNTETPSSAPPPYDIKSNEHDDESVDVKSAVSQASATVASTAQVTYDELKQKLAQAEAQLVSLKDGGLRQRKVPGSNEKTVEQVAQQVKQTVEGVPVQIVALLCLLSFLLAYFFF